MEITLTRQDIIDWKKSAPINEIKSFDYFKQESITSEEVLRADIINFKDGDNITFLKSRN